MTTETDNTDNLGLADLRDHVTEVRAHLTVDIDLAYMTHGMTPEGRYAFGLEIAEVASLLQKAALVQFQAVEQQRA